MNDKILMEHQNASNETDKKSCIGLGGEIYIYKTWYTITFGNKYLKSVFCYW